MHWQEEHGVVPALQLHMDPVLRGVHVYRLFRLDALLTCIQYVNLTYDVSAFSLKLLLLCRITTQWCSYTAQ